MYAKTPDQLIRSAICAAGGLARDMPVLDSPALLRRLMEMNPTLTEEGAKGLLAQYRDLAAEESQQAELSDYVTKT